MAEMEMQSNKMSITEEAQAVITYLMYLYFVSNRELWTMC